MFIALAILLAAAALLAVAYPILRGAATAGPETASAQEALDELLAQREAGLQALRELSFDHRLGKIADEDFVAFEVNLKRNAAHTLRALDHWETRTDDALGRELEQEITSHKAALSAHRRSCPSCGQPTAADDRFCAACGAALSAARPAVLAPSAACPKCGRTVEPGDRFCAACGQAL